MKKLHYGWVVCICCTLLMTCCMGLTVNAFSVYLPYIKEAGNFNNSQISLIPTIRSLFSLLSMLIVTVFFRRTGLRFGLTMVGLLAAASFLVNGLAVHLAAYYVAGAMMGLSYGLGGIVAASLVIDNWFKSRKGLALGICASGSGLGAVVGPTAITALVEARGLSFSFLCETAFVLAVSVLAFFLLRSTPEELGMTSYEDQRHRDEAALKLPPAPVCTEPLSRKEWILFFPAFIALGMAATPGPSYYAVHFTDCGFDSMTAALAISTCGLVLTGSKFIFGAISDRIGCRKSSTVYLVTLMAGLAINCLLKPFPSTALLFTAVCLMGFGFPPSTVGLSLWAGDLNTPERYAVTVRRFQTGYFVGALLGSSLPGVLADVYGSYVPGYALHILFIAVILTAVQIMYGRKLRKENAQSAPGPLS